MELTMSFSGSHPNFWHGGQRAFLRAFPRLFPWVSDPSTPLQRRENQKHEEPEPRRFELTSHMLQEPCCLLFFCKQWGVSFCVSSTDIDQLITISGMVIRTSQLIPEMQEAFFQCQVCAYSTRVEVDRGRIAEPAVCRHCNTTHSLALIHNRSVFSDKQMVRVCS